MLALIHSRAVQSEQIPPGTIGEGRIASLRTSSLRDAPPEPFRESRPRMTPSAAERFRTLVLPLTDDAYTLAKWLCRNPADAEDIVQEAAMRALKALETTSVERPKAW